MSPTRCASRRLGFEASDILLFVEVVVLEVRLIDWEQLFLSEWSVDIRVVEVVLCASWHEDWLHFASLESVPVEALEPSVLLQFAHAAASSDSIIWMLHEAFVGKVCSFHGPASDSGHLLLQDLGLE